MSSFPLLERYLSVYTSKTLEKLLGRRVFNPFFFSPKATTLYAFFHRIEAHTSTQTSEHPGT